MSKISNKIRKIRTDNNLTQEEFANIINVSRPTIALYEKGLRKPDINIVKVICDKFNISIEEFYDNSINKKNNKLKTILLILVSSLVLTTSLVINHFVKINETYGYNIYNDKLKVENSTDIIIIKVKNLISETKSNEIYEIIVVQELKENISRKKYIFDKLTITNKNINLENNSIYLLFNSLLCTDSSEKGNYLCNIEINNKMFIEKLDNYDESLSFDKQTGKSGKIINYYIDLIDKK